MSHLLAPQDEKRDSRVTQSEPVMTDASFLVPPQEEKSGQTTKAAGQSWLVPPQEEKADVAGLRGEQARLDQAIGRMEDRVNQHRIDHDLPSTLDELAQEKQQRDAILSGSSGVTGEDFGVAEKPRLVRRS